MAYAFDEHYWNKVIFGSHFLHKFSFAICSKIVLQWEDSKIPLKDLNEFFDTNMMTDLN